MQAQIKVTFPMNAMSARTPASAIWLVTVVGSAILIPGVAAGQDQAPEREVPPARWRVASEAQIVLGVRDGPPELQFVNPRHAAGLSDGALVVADGARNYFELRVYDAAGALHSSCGRDGQGPFESVALSSLVRLPGDSVLLLDRDNRFSVFGPRCEPVRSGRFHVPPRGFRPLLAFDQGHLLVYRYHSTDAHPKGRREHYGLFLFDEATRNVDSLATVEGAGAIGDRGLILHFPFQKRAEWVVGQGWVWFGDGGERVVTGRAPGTDAVRTIRLDLPRHPVQSSDVARWKEWDLEGTEGPRRRTIEAHHRGLESPDSFPVFQDLHVDAAGRLWVLEYRPPWSQEDYTWHVIDPAGETVAIASVPFGVQGPEARTGEYSHSILDIGTDYLLVRVKDDLGVPYVKKHEIIKESR